MATLGKAQPFQRIQAAKKSGEDQASHHDTSGPAKVRIRKAPRSDPWNDCGLRLDTAALRQSDAATQGASRPSKLDETLSISYNI